MRSSVAPSALPEKTVAQLPRMRYVPAEATSMRCMHERCMHVPYGGVSAPSTIHLDRQTAECAGCHGPIQCLCALSRNTVWRQSRWWQRGTGMVPKTAAVTNGSEWPGSVVSVAGSGDGARCGVWCVRARKHKTRPGALALGSRCTCMYFNVSQI